MPVPDNLIASIDELEPLPVTIQNLISAVQKDHVEFQEVADIVERDEALISNVLRAVNSTSNAGREPITNTRTAVIRLGTSFMLEMALSRFLQGQTLAPDIYDLDETDLWRHGMATRQAVCRIIALRPDAGIHPLAPTAAIVHDVGKLIMVRYMKAEIAEILACCEEKGITFVEAEREIFGCDHAEVGAEIGRAWGFPDLLVEVIEQHHSDPVENPSPLLDAVMVANHVSKTIGVGLGAQGMNVNLDPASLERLGLGYEDYCRITAETAVEMQRL